jgi:hypothetical protein
MKNIKFVLFTIIFLPLFFLIFSLNNSYGNSTKITAAGVYDKDKYALQEHITFTVDPIVYANSKHGEKTIRARANDKDISGNYNLIETDVNSGFQPCFTATSSTQGVILS